MAATQFSRLIAADGQKKMMNTVQTSNVNKIHRTCMTRDEVLGASIVGAPSHVYQGADYCRFLEPDPFMPPASFTCWYATHILEESTNVWHFTTCMIRVALDSYGKEGSIPFTMKSVPTIVTCVALTLLSTATSLLTTGAGSTASTESASLYGTFQHCYWSSCGSSRSLYGPFQHCYWSNCASIRSIYVTFQHCYWSSCDSCRFLYGTFQHCYWSSCNSSRSLYGTFQHCYWPSYGSSSSLYGTFQHCYWSSCGSIRSLYGTFQHCYWSSCGSIRGPSGTVPPTLSFMTPPADSTAYPTFPEGYRPWDRPLQESMIHLRYSSHGETAGEP
uniref:Uncharacterized protein n=1 Tax=Branchiostoma floridae TaxID=7739 RepID=C3YUY6_BRAFL|eukprot:XP_002599837.1 hypothetical protein BRAFLDRAFT_95526 [Branchiostoma floridae]